MSGLTSKAGDGLAGRPERDERGPAIIAGLGGRSIALVGMMGAGKTVIGASWPPGSVSLHRFRQRDRERRRMTISEIFSRHGEPYFRDRECRVIDRLMADGPRIVATGGGSFIHPATRAEVRQSRGCRSGSRPISMFSMRRVAQARQPPAAADRRSRGDPQTPDRGRYPIYAAPT